MSFESKPTHFGGSPLNRLSWLRPAHSFLNAIVDSTNTRWVLFNAGQPLLVASTSSGTKRLAQIPTASLKQLLGPTPYFGQLAEPGSVAGSDYPSLESARHLAEEAPVVFLGLLESDQTTDRQDGSQALPSSSFSGANPAEAIANIQGTAFFALEVANLNKDLLKRVISTTEFGALEFVDALTAMAPSILDPVMAAIFAEARSMLDWNTRNLFCPACGSKTYSLWGGWKRNCRTLLPFFEGKVCITAKGLHNFTHPRTDPVVIMVVINELGDRILLGKAKKFPSNFYSALAGFVEPAESFEDAVKREIWEEAGLKVHGVTYHASQVWPFPANLMVGFYARADSSQTIRTDLDNELEDAQWFTREEVLTVLNHPDGTNMTGRDRRKLAAIQTEGNNTAPKITAFVNEDGKNSSNTNTDNIASNSRILVKLSPGVALQDTDEPPFRVPPITAIAGVLIRDWVDGNAKVANFQDSFIARKGNL